MHTCAALTASEHSDGLTSLSRIQVERTTVRPEHRLPPEAYAAAAMPTREDAPPTVSPPRASLEGQALMSDITIEHDDDITIVTMNRPERHNAVDGAMAAELADAFRAFDVSESRVAVLAGNGPSFCAGANLKAVGTPAGNRISTTGDGPMGISRMELRKPVIAAVHGHAVAGGLELALWCDLRVVEETATFGVFCRRWGVPLIDGGTIRLPRLIGHSRAIDLILTGRPVDAREALSFGLGQPSRAPRRRPR